MARILFTVCGVGMGHAGRSAMLIKQLKKRHKVKVLSYGQGEKFLKTNFKVQTLEWFDLVFEKDRYKPDATFFLNLPRLPRVFFKNLVTLTRIIEDFRPQVVISDFDVNGIYVAKLFGIPSITISNMHIINFVDIELGIREKLAYFLNHRYFLDAFSPTDFLLVVYPFKPKKGFKNTEFFSHLVREDFLVQKISDKGYFLVYSTPSQLEAIIPVLRRIDGQKFVVRGGSAKSFGNVEFRKGVSLKRFAKELACCRGVICHGGLSIISEAITLKKPVYVFSDMKFFERYFNGKTVEKLGFGMVEETPSPGGIQKFIESIPAYKKSLLEKNTGPSNKEFVKRLEALVEEFSQRPQKNLAERLKEVRELIKENNPKKVFKKIMLESDFKKFLGGDFKKFYSELMKENGPKK